MGYFNLLFVATDFWANVRVGNTRVYPLIKRVVSTIIAAVLLVLLAPLFLLFTLAIRLDSPGPALFRQTRIGKDGKPFSFYKFRSMYHDIDRSAHQAFLKDFVKGKIQENSDKPNFFKPAQASQITRVGRLLRKTSLDELPQLLNILKGEMSFIGPRPNVPAEVEAYSEWHARRLAVLPGVTGWAQVNGRSSISFDQIARFDIEYIENESFLMDLKVVLATIPAVLRGHGAR